MANNEAIFERAQQLFNLERYQQATDELLKLLAFEPSNSDALRLLTACYINVGNTQKARQYANLYLAAQPDESVAHYYNALVLTREDKPQQSEQSIREAIRIDVYEPAYWGFLAALYIDKKEWKQALNYANKGLEYDPEHITCLNHRTLCLNKLNLKEELSHSINETLDADPNNYYTHSNVGWSKLEQNKPKEAITHFRESLRLNPNYTHAEEGLRHAIKAKNLIYNAFLNYQFWIGNQKRNLQWVVILGILFAQKILPFPFNIAIYIFVFSIWLIEPLSNLVLLFDENGKYLLNKYQKIGAIGTGGLIITLTLAIVIVVGVKPKQNDLFFIMGVVSVLSAIPFSRWLENETSFNNKWLLVAGVGVPFLGFVGVFLSFLNFAIGDLLSTIALLGGVVFTWIFGFNSTR